MFRNYGEAVAWITKRMTQHGIKPGLQRMNAVMERLGHPHRRLKFIHVAGTNGKGSTCAFLASAIQGAGYGCGLFTSPYLEKYSNRLQYNGQDIPEDTLVALANQIKRAADEAEPEYGALTMFEISTALAVLYYAKVSCPDFVVWETGIGGRLDSTNIVFPIVSVITNVGFDHTDLLGDTLADIAREKAGIIKPGVPVVSAATDPSAAEVIRSEAAARKSALYEWGTSFRHETRDMREGRQIFDFYGPFRTIGGVRLSMNGAYQQTNAAVALMTLEVLRQYYALVLDDGDLYASLERTQWKGRLETVSRQPRIVIDGAHNADGARSLAEALRTVYSYDRLVFVLGMVRNKNHREYLRHILPIVNTLVVTEPDFFKKMPADELAQEVYACSTGPDGPARQLIVEADWKLAIERAREAAGPDDLIVAAGSLYFISDARSWLLNQQDSEKGW